MHASALRPLVATTALLLALSAFGADETDAPVAKPQVKVGDRWTYRITNNLTGDSSVISELRVASTGPDEILVVSKRRGSGNENDNFFTSEWNERAVGAWVQDPHNGHFKFPLKVGASHESTYESAQKATGIRGRMEKTVKVVGWEDVTVPAGKFRALKVEAKGTYRRLDQRAEGGWTSYTHWYAPGVKRWVKSTYAIGTRGPASPDTSTTIELVDFSVQ